MNRLLFLTILLFGTFFFAKDVFATANVYYSVGQSSSNLLAGTSVTLTLTSGAAVFSVAQSGNIGVGDRVTYDTDNKVAYIAAKTNADQMHWTLITKTGGTPADVSGVAVTSIKHEYTSLFAAEAGAVDSSHINNTDLTVADVVLNIPCYYDSGPDTTAVTINGYTTDGTRYIKIYTPTSTTSEANNSQRHSGKWDEGKYNLANSSGSVFEIESSNVKIIGLQVRTARTNGNSSAILCDSAVHDVNISNNIVRNSGLGDYVYGINIANSSISNLTIWNNIVYDFNTGLINANTGIRISTSDGTLLYNNTVHNSSYGIIIGYNDAIAINNIVNGSGNSNAYVGYFASGTDYNATDGTDDIGAGTHNKLSQTFSFVNSANKDFHLAPTDTGAKDYGTDLSGIFNIDIDGNTRPFGAAWDIGADELIYLESKFRGYVNMRGNVNVR